MSDVTLEGMAISEGVIETIVSLALTDVPGISCVGTPNPAGGILSKLGSKPAHNGVEVVVFEDDSLGISVHIEVLFGVVIPDVAEAVRSAVVDAVTTQVGLPVTEVNVCVEGVAFGD